VAAPIQWVRRIAIALIDIGVLMLML